METKDDYKLLKNGDIKLVAKTNDKTDKLYATDSKGNVNQKKSITLEKGVLENGTSGSVKIGKQTVSYNGYFAKGSTANSLFKFGAANSNVEWGLGKFKDGENVVTTSHEHTREAGISQLLFNNPSLDLGSKGIIELDNSHPDGVHYPSGTMNVVGASPEAGNDVKFARGVERAFPGSTPKFNIYTATDGEFTPFTSHEQSSGMLHEVIITPSKN
jgi:hypothetical protein